MGPFFRPAEPDMIEGPDEIAVRALHKEMQRIRALVLNSRWFLFGSITTTKRPVGDIDLLVVCKSVADCTTVRTELTSICARFPIHLLLMTQREEGEIKFIVKERAVEISTATRQGKQLMDILRGLE